MCILKVNNNSRHNLKFFRVKRSFPALFFPLFKTQFHFRSSVITPFSWGSKGWNVSMNISFWGEYFGEGFSDLHGALVVMGMPKRDREPCVYTPHTKTRFSTRIMWSLGAVGDQNECLSISPRKSANRQEGTSYKHWLWINNIARDQV